MGISMGISKQLGGSEVALKRKFRWMMEIKEVCGDQISVLPPNKGARPSLTFKESSVQHLNEEIFFPTKTEWKPITLILYDTSGKKHPVVEWLSKIYEINKESGFKWKPSIGQQFKKDAKLKLYDGCGNVMESWVMQNAWPQSVEFGDLDMGSQEIVTVSVTLRYDRAYRENEGC